MTAALPWLVVVILLLAGIYGIVTSRNSIHLVNCLTVAQSSTYILLVSVGFRRGGTAPILDPKHPGAVMVDPVVQAMSLTDIVVGAAVSALLLILAIQSHKRSGSLDPRRSTPMRG